MMVLILWMILILLVFLGIYFILFVDAGYSYLEDNE